MNKEIVMSRKVAKKVLKTVDAGLVSGLGKAEPGKMCIEAAVCYALGLPHGDNPPCVGYAVRRFKIQLNDCKWPSEQERTKGMRKLAVAQLGSNEIDQKAFIDFVAFECMKRALPFNMRNAVKVSEEKNIENKYNPEILELAKRLESAKDLVAAKEITKEAKKLMSDANAYAYANAYANANAYAYANANAYAYAYADANADAYANANAYAYAYADAYANAKFKLELLNLIAQIILEALIELKSPGCEWLDLCD